MRTVFYISVIALGSLTNALGALLPRGVSDVSQTPEV